MQPLANREIGGKGLLELTADMCIEVLWIILPSVDAVCREGSISRLLHVFHRCGQREARTNEDFAFRRIDYAGHKIDQSALACAIVADNAN